MPFLSKVTLKTAGGSTGTLRDIIRQNCGIGGQHKLIWTLFSEVEGASRDFLFRSVESDKWLVLSQRKPVDRHAIWNIESKPFNPVVQNEDRLSFRLRANATVSIRNDAGKRVRHDVVHHAILSGDRPNGKLPKTADVLPSAAYQWLSAKGKKSGFCVSPENLIVDGYTEHRFPSSSGSASLRSVDFTGFLTVTDKDRFLPSVLSGFGGGKAFGFGMLLLSRAPFL